MRKLVLVVLLMLLVTFVPVTVSGDTPSAYVAGTTSLAGGEPLPGVTVLAQNTTGPDGYQVQSGSAGGFNIPLPLGTYNVSASREGYVSNVTYNEVTVGAQGLLLAFTMTPLPGEVRGYVSNGSTPVYGATVQLSDGTRNYSATSLTPLGQYLITGMGPGAYSGQAFKLGYNTSIHLGVIVVRSSEITYVNFSLEEQPASLSGKTVTADGVSPLEGVTVQLSSADFTVETTSDANGHYSLQRIPAGSYSLSYSKSGYQRQSYTMNFNPYEVKTFDAKMERSATNPSTYLFGYDLAHSLMLVALIVAILTMAAAIFLVFRLGKQPELLMKMEEDAPEEEKKEDN